MRSGRRIIFGGFRNDPIGIANEKQIQGVFFIVCSMHRQILKHKLTKFIFLHLNFRKIKDRFGGVILIKQIVSVPIVDFEIAHIDFEGVCGCVFNMTKNVGQCSRNDASVHVALSPARYCESLARPRLPVRKNGAIVAVKAPIDHILRHFLKNTLLFGEHVENAVELELVIVVLDFSVPQTVPLEVELNLAFIWGQRQTKVWLFGGSHTQKHLNAFRFTHFI